MSKAAWLALWLAPSAGAVIKDPFFNTRPPETRPFRVGVFEVNREFSRSKPLASSVKSGWVVSSGLLVGSFSEDWLVAYQLPTMIPRWWVPLKQPLAAPIADFGSWVVVGLRDGSLQKHEVLTGKEVWRTQTPIDSFSERSLVLAGSNLLVMTAAQVLYNIDYQSGETKWLYDAGFPDQLTIRAGAAPIVVDNQVIVGTADGSIHSINLETGKLHWSIDDLGTDQRFRSVVGELVVRQGRLILTRYDGVVAAYDLASRGKIWSTELSSLTTSRYRSGRYYVGSVAGDVIAFDEASGRQVWQSHTGQAVSQIVVGETSLLVAGSDGRVSALDTSSGGLQWFDDLAGDISSPPVFFRGDAFFATGARVLYGYRLN